MSGRGSAGGQSTKCGQVAPCPALPGRVGGGELDGKLRRGDLMGRAGGGHLGRIARIGAVALGCLALAGCSASKVFSDKYSPRVVADGEPVPKGGGGYQVGQPYTINGQTYSPVRKPLLSQRRHRLLVRPGFPRPPHRQRRSLRHARHLGRASDHADAELCARDQSRQRPLHHRARQRSRALCPQPNHRRLDRGRQCARLLRRGARACAGRICRARAARRQRRPRPAGDVAGGTPRPGAPAAHGGVGGDHSFRASGTRRGETPPIPPERPFALGGAAGRVAAKPTTVNVATASAAPTRAQKVTELDVAPRAEASPIATYAPVRNDGVLGLMSGRGLY